MRAAAAAAAAAEAESGAGRTFRPGGQSAHAPGPVRRPRSCPRGQAWGGRGAIHAAKTAGGIAAVPGALRPLRIEASSASGDLGDRPDPRGATESALQRYVRAGYSIANPIPDAGAGLEDSGRRVGGVVTAMNDEKIEVEGRVSAVLGNDYYRVELANGSEALARPAGRLRKFRIRTLLGDRVLVELSEYDLTRGRITYRFRD